MAFFPTEGAEPIPGYQLISKLGTGGYGEVWKATAPGGLTKAIKIIYGHMADSRAEQELRALGRIKEVRHPFLLSLERYEITGEQVFIVTELADASLMDRYEECRKAGLPGISRQELLSYFRDAADALDYMSEHYGLQHLDIKPQNLLLVAGRIKIADFGLVKDLSGTSATATGGVTPIYASPEAFDGKVSRFSDQYSLAIVYQEMLTGIRPFPGRTALQLAAQHMNSPPLLDPLPAADRPVIGRALSKSAHQRYPTCREMVEALLRNPAPEPAAAAAPPAPPVAPEAKAPAAELPEGMSGEELLNLDTIAGFELPARVAPTPPVEQRPVVKKPREVVRRAPLPLPKTMGEVKLRPTLFVGVGGLAGSTLRRLRQRLAMRFGDLEAVPLFRFLLLDTDRSALRAAQQGKPGEALESDETLALPLHRPEHYRTESRELLRWLDRRWLYNVPRTQLTEGKRPFGRLAFVHNAAHVLPRLREALAAITSPEAREAALAATGLGLRDETPRVFVVGSVSGGTGSGALLDLAYAVRQVLGELHLDAQGLCGVLMHATSLDHTLRELARVNAFATLAELNHFSRPDASYPGDPHYQLAAAGPGNPPFPTAYLVHLGETLGQSELDAATDGVAEYLYLDAATGAGEFFDRYRQGTDTPPAGPLDRVELRTFRLYRLSFPRYPLAELAAEQLCRHVVSRWLGEPARSPAAFGAGKGPKGDLRAAAKGEVLGKAAELGLEPNALADRLQAAVRGLWGEDPETHLQRVLADWVQARTSPQGRPAGDTGAQVLDRIDELLGDGDQSDGPDDAEFARRLRKQANDIGTAIGEAAVGWLVTLVEDPQKRLKSADIAADALAEHLSTLGERARSVLAEMRVQRNAVRARLGTATLAGKGGGSRWLPLGRRQDAGGESRQRFLEYGSLRLKEVVLENAVEVFQAVARAVAGFSGELRHARERLSNFIETFAAPPQAEAAPQPEVSLPNVTEFFPGRATNLDAAADLVCRDLGPGFTTAFDEKIEGEVLRPNGGLWALASRNINLADRLQGAIRVRAQAAILEALKDVDAARLFLDKNPDPGLAEQALAADAQAAQPRVTAPGAWQHLVLAAPPGKPGDQVRDLVGKIFANVPTTTVNSDGDVVLCYEAAHLPLPQVAAALIEHGSSYADVAGKFVTRVDVKWTPLQLPGQ